MQLELQGVTQLYMKLDNAAADKVLERPMKKALTRIERYMKKYPRPPQNSTYVRTRTLGDRWSVPEAKRVDVMSGAVVGTIANNVWYGPLVQSARFQAKVHQRRWQTDEMAVEATRAEITGDFQKAITDALSKY